MSIGVPDFWILFLHRLVKFDQSLTALLSSRQKDLHSLLGNTVDNEDEVDRLLDVFSFEDGSAPAMLDGQQQFDMEELDWTNVELCFWIRYVTKPSTRGINVTYPLPSPRH